MTIETALGIKLVLLVPASLGALMGLRWIEDPLADKGCSACRKATVFVGGIGFGLYGAPAVVDTFELADPSGRLEMAYALLVAALGLAVISNIVRAIRSVDWKAIIESWLTRR